MSAPRGLLTARAIRWAIGLLRRESATIQGLARQLGTTWNTLWSQVEPLLEDAASDERRVETVQVLGVDEHIWHHRDPRQRGPKEITEMVDLTRGLHPAARLLDLVPGRSVEGLPRLADRARRRVPRRGRDRHAGSVPGLQERDR